MISPRILSSNLNRLYVRRFDISAIRDLMVSSSSCPPFPSCKSMLSIRNQSSTSSISTNFIDSGIIAPQSSGTMKDEYGTMDSTGETFRLDEFLLESGEILENAEVS